MTCRFAPARCGRARKWSMRMPVTNRPPVCLATLLSGGHVLVHCAGLMDSTLTMSYGKFLLDAEQVEMAYKLGQGPQLDGLEEAMAAVRQVPPGGHYLGSDHTLKHFQTAFYMPELQDTSVYEDWEESGSKDSRRTRQRQSASDD